MGSASEKNCCCARSICWFFSNMARSMFGIAGGSDGSSSSSSSSSASLRCTSACLTTGVAGRTGSCDRLLLRSRTSIDRSTPRMTGGRAGSFGGNNSAFTPTPGRVNCSILFTLMFKLLSGGDNISFKCDTGVVARSLGLLFSSSYDEL